MSHFRTVLFCVLTALLLWSPGSFTWAADTPKIPPAGATRVNPRDGAVMVYVPAGPFLMGDTSFANNPRRTVRLDGFWIYKNDVTVGQYRKFCQATRREMPPMPWWGWRDNHPVVNVTWADSKAYCDWAHAALPAEAQWEKAARGTDGRRYPWGSHWDPGKLQCSKKNIGDAGSTAPVGSFPAGASPYGCLDMAGNVWQWCAGRYDPSYDRNSGRRKPQVPATGQRYVLRGGCRDWFDEGTFRSACRCMADPTDKSDTIGFRAVRADLN